jgi:1-deoxy-D-xylulose 5-phosphate reductoisomerase
MLIPIALGMAWPDRLDDVAPAVDWTSAQAWEFFQSQPPSYRKTASWWVMSAKREETRKHRLETLIADSAGRRRIGALARPTKAKQADGSFD